MVSSAISLAPDSTMRTASSVPAMTRSRVDADLLAVGRVHDEVAVDEPHPDGADRALEGNSGQAERRRGAIHGEDVGIVLLVARDGQADDLHLVAEHLGKERPDRPVDQARGQDLLLDGRSFALEVATGNAPTRVSALTIFDGERKKVLGLTSASGRHAGGQDHRPAVANDYGAVGLLGDVAGFHRKGKTIDIDRYGMTHTNACPRGSAVCRRPS